MNEAAIHIDAQIQVRHDIEANWAAVDPVLRDGEVAYSKDLNRIKVGDGARKWSDLKYLGGTNGDAASPRQLFFDVAEILAFAGPINRQTREQLYNIFTYTEGNDISSEPAWVIDTNGQHYIVRMLQTETGVGFFIIGYEGYTRIEGDSTKTNQLLRDKIDKAYVKDFLSQASFDPAKTHDYIIPKVESYTSVEDSVGAGGRSVNFSIGLRVKDDISNAAEDDLDNGIFRNGLVTALGVKNWVENKGYLTSAAMNGYATKDEIKDFVTKGTTLEHYGITDAVKWSNSISSSAPAEMGYGYPSKDWKTSGPAISFGTNGYILRLQGLISDTDIPTIYASYIYNGVAKGWAELLTVESLASRDLDALRLFLKGDLVLHRSGDIETYLNYGAATNDNASLLAYGNQFGVHTGSKEGGYGLAFSITADKTARFYGGITLGTRTIYSWSDFLTTGGGTINGNLDITKELRGKAISSPTNSYVTNKWRIVSAGDNTWLQSGTAAGDTGGTLILSGFTGEPAKEIRLSATTISAQGELQVTSKIKLGEQSIAKWSDVAGFMQLQFINKDAFLMTTNAFDNTGRLEASYAANALYAADKRFIVSGEGFSQFKEWGLFNGSYDDDNCARVEAGTSAILTISNNGLSIINGYPYGEIYLSFYYTSVPESVKFEVYCNYESQGVGWKELPLLGKRGNHNNIWYYNNSYYNITQIRITITALASARASLSEIDFHLKRASLSNLPIVTKFGIDQELWGRLICQGGLTLDNKTVFSWSDFITSDGGTINAGKHLNFGDGASIVWRQIQSWEPEKLFVSGGVSIGNLYMRERIFIEEYEGLGARIAFRDKNGAIIDSITTFDDLRIKVVEQTATSGVSIAPNVLNKWTTPLTGALTINFSTGRSTVANYYMIEFKTGNTAPTISLPSGITWQDGDNILARLEPNKTYQISILNNLAVGGAF